MINVARDIPHSFTGHLALHDLGILVEPDSREPWFLCESHNVGCLGETLDKFERAVDITLPKPETTHENL